MITRIDDDDKLFQEVKDELARLEKESKTRKMLNDIEKEYERNRKSNKCKERYTTTLLGGQYDLP